MMSDTLQRAIAAIRSGDKETGQRLLAEVIRNDPRNETAWLWMSSVIDSDEHRRDCLKRVLAINPHNEAARRGLAALDQPAPSVSKEPVGGALQHIIKQPKESPSKGNRLRQVVTEPPVVPDTRSAFAIESVLLWAILIGSIGMVVWGCSRSMMTGGSSSPTPSTPRPGRLITQEQFGDDWPFSVSEARIECKRGYAVIIHLGSHTYALNGVAKDAGYDDLRYSDVWLDDPEIGYDYKKSLAPVVRWGVDYCNVD